MPNARTSDGLVIFYSRLGGHGPPVLLAHATGFCGEVWRPVAERLATTFTCWALDFRGHGRSERPGEGAFGWAGTALDVLAVIDAVDSIDPAAGPWSAAGHSMGGAALLLAEQARPGTFGSMWLFEPIVMPPDVAGVGGDVAGGLGLALSQGAARRTRSFASRALARENYRMKPPMASFHPHALDGYLDGGFREADDGSVELSCRPSDEAEFFMMGSTHTAQEHLSDVECPVAVVHGDTSRPGPAMFAPAIAAGLAGGRLEQHPNLSHFGPMEDPDAIAESIVVSVGPPTMPA